MTEMRQRKHKSSVATTNDLSAPRHASISEWFEDSKKRRKSAHLATLGIKLNPEHRIRSVNVTLVFVVLVINVVTNVGGEREDRTERRRRWWAPHRCAEVHHQQMWCS